MEKQERRYQDFKHKKKTVHIVKDIWKNNQLANDERFIGIEAGVHSRRCSCPMCRRTRRNPWLKTEKLTLAERRELQNEKDTEEQE